MTKSFESINENIMMNLEITACAENLCKNDWKMRQGIL